MKTWTTLSFCMVCLLCPEAKASCDTSVDPNLEFHLADKDTQINIHEGNSVYGIKGGPDTIMLIISSPGMIRFTKSLLNSNKMDTLYKVLYQDTILSAESWDINFSNFKKIIADKGISPHQAIFDRKTPLDTIYIVPDPNGKLCLSSGGFFDFQITWIGHDVAQWYNSPTILNKRASNDKSHRKRFYLDGKFFWKNDVFLTNGKSQ